MKKLLIIDDDDVVRQLVALTIGSDEYEVLEAAEGNEGLEIARREKPGLVFLDVRLPDADGFEICRTLKLDPATRDITVVMLTSMTQPADRARGLGAGADDYFVKPFSPLALLQKVDAVLGS